MARELMNPLGISSKNFVVAEDASTGDRLGWAQIRSLGPADVDPDVLNSPPGSMPYFATVEDDVDDMMWEEFEEDPDANLGTWRSTLPWSKEYKTAMEAAARRRDRRAVLVAEEEVERKNTRVPQLWELASVYVVPDRRSEGIGRALVRSVLDQHRDLGRGGEAVYALTLSSTLDWYAENFGFVSVEDPGQVPKPMAFEVAAGTAISKLMGNQLVCLRLPLEMTNK
jgi:GNAT superfamily N-acetyltransferase